MHVKAPSDSAPLDKERYESLALELRSKLLSAQFGEHNKQHATIVVLGGLEGSGKGALAQRINEWMDPRHIETDAFWEHSDEEESRPWFWRFWRKLPPRGSMSLMIGAWYSAPAYALAEGKIDDADFTRQCQRIQQFESMLSAEGTRIIKLGINVNAQFQQMQLAEEAPHAAQHPRVPLRINHDKVSYAQQVAIVEKLMKATHTDLNPWQLIDGNHRYTRDLAAGKAILAGMSGSTRPPPTPESAVFPASPGHLGALDMGLRLSKSDYKEQLAHYQQQLQELAWQAHKQQRATIAVFEGWDAAGKGSAIRRVTSAIDPRLYKVVQFAAPTDEENAHHYLWRFWRRLQRDGRSTLFDRSWYGRVLVERVEGFASDKQWQRAYGEINEFERQLTEHGAILLKFWIHLSPEEQLQRFEERSNTAHKRYKITEEDWRNRDKWPLYEQAVEAMIAGTNTAHAPWTLIEGDNKRYARIKILKTFCQALANGGVTE
jgi:AMP-polyphosphate phosphotransferase